MYGRMILSVCLPVLVCFQSGRYYHAVIQYQRIVSWLEMECGIGKEQQQAIQALLLVAHLNLALCYLRLREYSQTVENCNKVEYRQPYHNFFNLVFIIIVP